MFCKPVTWDVIACNIPVSLLCLLEKNPESLGVKLAINALTIIFTVCPNQKIYDCSDCELGYLHIFAFVRTLFLCSCVCFVLLGGGGGKGRVLSFFLCLLVLFACLFLAGWLMSRLLMLKVSFRRMYYSKKACDFSFH